VSPAAEGLCLALVVGVSAAVGVVMLVGEPR
jgi:hypothetical protein